MSKSLLLISILSLRVAFAEPPQLADERLQLKLFAEDPQIVTPIGMAIDQRDRIFVIESHTHLPPADYNGPKGDRIKLFVDNNHDGKSDDVTVFAEGIQQAMNLAVSPDGVVFVVCAREVLRLDDEDGDGVCDRKVQVLKLVTKERYAHNSLLGITFDRKGWLYVARGNTGSQYYRFTGAAAGSNNSVEGYGDGGNVIRFRQDGSQIEEFATGFWNPFDLKFDRAGRLLLVDNDPDARGPNRLLHVAQHGDYGYKSLYGGGGNHPFQGWDGSLPGTLPFIAGTGEAPSGLMDCKLASLPAEYQDSVLATIWNENTIERFDLQPSGRTLSLRKKSVFMSGGKDFRPVAIACDSRGNIYVTDWMLVSYPNHGRGRIWRISVKDEFAPLASAPENYFAPYATNSPQGSDAKAEFNDDYLVRKLRSNDAFEAHEAVIHLAASKLKEQRTRLLHHQHAKVRLGAVLASRRAGDEPYEILINALRDPDENVRLTALVWAGESMQPELRPLLDSVLQAGEVSTNLFDTYLAAAENLSPRFIGAYHQRLEAKSNKLERVLPTDLLHEVLNNEEYAANVRGLAVSKLDDESFTEIEPSLLKFLTNKDDELALAIVQRIVRMPNASASWKNLLVQISLDARRSTALRCETLLGLSYHKPKATDFLKSLLNDPERDVSIEAVRTQRAWATDTPQGRPAIESERRPQTDEQWSEELSSGGSPARGRRVFICKRATCSKCHTIAGRGQTLGPALGSVGRSKTRRQIIDAILNPSAEFPPQYQAWIVVTTDGKTHRGLQLDHKSRGAIEVISDDGTKRRFEADEIETYDASPTSLMPDGLEHTLTVDELRDLIAFLSQTSASRNPPDDKSTSQDSASMK